MSDWQPIESAPKDGTWVLLAGGAPRYGWYEKWVPPMVCAQWSTYLNGKPDGTEGRWQLAWYDGGHYGAYERPTHWMPLPSLPKDQT